MRSAELSLPKDILAQASVDGPEFAWPVECIPKVIKAARDADLINIGGQLQFRLRGCGTCECYWVEVDTYKSVLKSLSWQERVIQTANTAPAEYSRLQMEFDFLAEGQRAFPKTFAEYEHLGHDPADAMYFVWYLEAFNEPRAK